MNTYITNLFDPCPLCWNDYAEIKSESTTGDYFYVNDECTCTCCGNKGTFDAYREEDWGFINWNEEGE